MTEEQYQKVLAAVRSQEAKGVTVVSGEYGLNMLDRETWSLGECGGCPLACLLVETQPSKSFVSCAVFDVLGASEVEQLWFIRGFDGVGLAPWPNNTYADWFDAGVRMRKELGL